MHIDNYISSMNQPPAASNVTLKWDTHFTLSSNSGMVAVPSTLAAGI